MFFTFPEDARWNTDTEMLDLIVTEDGTQTPTGFGGIEDRIIVILPPEWDQGGEPVASGGDEGKPIDVAGHRDSQGTSLTPEELDAFNAAFGPPPEEQPQAPQPPQPPEARPPQQGLRPGVAQPPENENKPEDWRKRLGTL